MPRPGFWESRLIGRGESASFRVERVRGRRFVTAISTPAPDCGRLFGLYSNASGAPLRVPVGRGGHFRARRRKPSRDNVIDLG